MRGDSDLRALFAHLAERVTETIAFAYLDDHGRLLGERLIESDEPGSVRLPYRAVARDAMLLNATRVAMAHNHPSGDPQPSKADLAATKRLATALAALGVGLVEHLVLARAGRSFSLRGAGLL